MPGPGMLTGPAMELADGPEGGAGGARVLSPGPELPRASCGVPI